MTQLFSRIGVLKKRLSSSGAELPSEADELPSDDDMTSQEGKLSPGLSPAAIEEFIVSAEASELSLEDGMSSHEGNELSPEAIEEMSPEADEMSSADYGMPSQEGNKLSFAVVEELSTKADELSLEDGMPSQEANKLSPTAIEGMSPEANTPCAPAKYYFLLEQGVKLTDAAKELSDEKMNLLYEDIFKPLDFYSILHERSKQLSS